MDDCNNGWGGILAGGLGGLLLGSAAGGNVNCNSTLTLVVTASAGNPIVNNLYMTIEKL